MSTTWVFREDELRRAVGLAPAGVDAIAEGFAMLAAGRVRQPPVLRIDIPEHRGEVDVKAAAVEGWEAFAVKVSTGFFGNPERGLPAGAGLMVLLSAETGRTLAVLLDNGYLTRIRTALAGAVAARALARADVRVAGVLGAGDQARWQLRALRLVRQPETVWVWARRRNAAERYAREMRDDLGIDVRVARTPEEAAAAADVLITTTPATAPVLAAGALHPGLHVTAMGSDAPSKQELGVDVLAAADVIACDHLEQSRTLGELRAAEAAGAALPAVPVSLGDIVAGRHPGRTDPAQVTICDLTGTGVQDTVIARLAVQACLASGAGLEVPADGTQVDRS